MSMRIDGAPGRPRASAGLLAGVLLLTLATAAVLVFALSADEQTQQRRRRRARGDPPVDITVAVDASRPGRPVPRRFLGLSFEVGALAQIARYGQLGNMPALLRSLGPGLFRFGGISADTRTAWTDARDPKPAWASHTIGPADLRRLRRLAQASGWPIILTVGLAHYNPGLAAREVASAHAILGPWLAGIEIGNEPDSYERHGLRAPPWKFSQYNAQIAAYRRAIGRLTPGIPLAGPDVSGSKIFNAWGPKEVRSQRPAIITGHHYPLGCHTIPTPTIQTLLSGRIRAEERVSLTRYMRVARAGHIPLRVDEANSVSCGGVAGISDTFAAALWATSYITTTMSAGASGINLEGNPARCNGYSVICAPTPQRLAAGQLQAQPEWYALLLTRALIGDRPITTRMTAPAFANVTATALLASTAGCTMVLINDEPVGLSVRPRASDAPRRASLGPRHDDDGALAGRDPGSDARRKGGRQPTVRGPAQRARRRPPPARAR